MSTYQYNKEDYTISPVEIWKVIEGYEGIYEVSTFGNVRRSAVSSGTKGGLLKPGARNRYLSVVLSKNNKGKSYTIHRLVATTFISNLENKPTVNHIDGVKTNNMLLNLEWATHSEQQIHGIKTGLTNPISPFKKGDKHTEEAKKKMSSVKLLNYAEYRNKRSRILVHTETGIFYSFKEAAGYLGVEIGKIYSMAQHKSTLLKHKFLLT